MGDPTTDYTRAVLDAFPAIVLALDGDARIQEANLAATQFFGGDRQVLFHRLCGDVLQCVHSLLSRKPCGETDHCPDCVVRSACMAAIRGERIVRKRGRFQMLRGGKRELAYLLVSATPFDYQGTRHALVVLEDVTELTELRSMVPICANCKRVRRDSDYWQQVEEYVRQHVNVEFTHSICPACMKKLYPKA